MQDSGIAGNQSIALCGWICVPLPCRNANSWLGGYELVLKEQSQMSTVGRKLKALSSES